MAQFSFNNLIKKSQQGVWPYVITLVHMLLGIVLVYTSPRSNIAFLILITSFFSLYALKTDNRFKLIIGAIMALVIIPVVGVRNIFY